jgi:hypothetical protein
MEPLAVFTGDGFHVFRGEKNPNVNAENEVLHDMLTP